MPNPNRSDFHTNRPLTDLSVAHFQDENHFVAMRFAPTVKVKRRSDLYPIFDRGDFNRDEMKVRAPSTESAGGGWRLSSASYMCERYAFHKDQDVVDAVDADEVFDLDREANIYVSQKALLLRERIFSENFFTAGAPGSTWTFDADGVASSPTSAANFDPTDASNNDVLHWSDDDSVPFTDISNARIWMLRYTGFVPNTLVLGVETFEALIRHPDLLARVLYRDSVGTGNPAMLTEQSLAALFQVEKVLVMRSIYNTADEGLTATHAFRGGKHALLAHVAPRPGKYTPSAAYSFSWTGLPGLSPVGTRVRTLDLENITTRRVEIEQYVDLKVVSADLGYFFGGIVA